MEQLSRRELNKIHCRQRILKASRQLFSIKGYEETTMEDGERQPADGNCGG